MMNSWFLLSNPTNKAAKLLLYRNKSSKSWSLIKIRQISSTQFVFNNQAASSAQSSPTPQTPQPQKSGGSKVFKLLALALTGFTIGVGYVTLNPESRRQIEQTVPQSHQLFEFVDGILNGKKSNDFADFKNKFSTIETNKKPVEYIPPAPIIPKPSEPVQPPKKEQSPKALAPAVQKEPEPVVVTKEDWKATKRTIELQDEASIDAFEKKLSGQSANVKQKVSEALNSSYVAIESLNKYRQALRQALDETKNEEIKELQWRQVTDLFDIQTADVNQANEKFTLAKKLIEDLDSSLKEAKSNELSKNIKNLRTTQVELINQYRILQAEQTKLNEAIVHANVLRTYTSEQKIARNQFLKEMQALQPEGINKSSGDNLSNEEINSLLIHAHKRVLQLQKQIEKIQLSQNQQIQAALEDQQRQNSEYLKKHDANLYDLHKKEFELEKEKLLELERIKAGEELKRELARQAAAHNNHLAQMLRIQQEELSSIYDKKLIAENEKTRTEFYNQVSQGIGRVKGIEHALNARANLEFQANNAKQLWLAVQNLNEIISTKAEDLLAINRAGEELVNIKANVGKIKESAPDNEFIQKIVGTIPSNLIENGVWSEPDLRDRFHRLKSVCNRVALIDERGGTLFKYFISYLQSFFIFHTKIDRNKLESNSEAPSLDDINLNTFSILDYAEYYIESGNLELALRLMQQLKGEPARLSKDWINDAIRLLEIKQASNLLTAYISSVYIGTNFK